MKFLSSRSFLALLTVFVLIGFGLRNGAIPTGRDPFAIYSQQVSQTKEISFRDVSPKLGVSFAEKTPLADTYISVGDFDNDGWEDVLLIYSAVLFLPSSQPKLLLLKNQQGRSFVDVTKASGLDKAAGRISAAAFIDFDNDGWRDLYFARRGVPHLVFKNERGKFRSLGAAAADVLGDSRGVVVLDYDNDGFVDLMVSNFHKKQFCPSLDCDQVPHTVVGYTGKSDFLLKNNGGKKLSDVTEAAGVSDESATWAIGVSDLNSDGFPDLFFANDFNFDLVFANRGGKFENISSRALGDVRSRFSMSAEGGDVDNDGRTDFFAANASKPGLMRGYNSLWHNKSGSGIQLRDDAVRFGLDKCGWAWGTKFADFDKDGHLDLFVVNGRSWGAPREKAWFIWLQALETPVPLRLKGVLGVRWADENLPIASGQRNCVFLQKRGSFLDVTDSVGVADEKNGRSLASFDYNNDGNEDMLILNVTGEPILYESTRTNSNNWFGLKLVGTKSNRDAIGGKVTLKTKRGLLQYKELFPTNGALAQSTKRMLFAVPAEDAIDSIEITWPSGAKQKLHDLALSRYHEIKEVQLD